MSIQTQNQGSSSNGNPNTEGNKKNNTNWQTNVLKALGMVITAINALPGVDYETRTTTYEAIAAGPGYSIGDIIVRYDIIDVATSTVVSTMWFNQTTQATIAAPAPANIIPYTPGGSVTVTNPFNLEATQLLIQTLLTSIDGTLNVPLSTVATEVTLSTRLSKADFEARINTLGQKISAASTPVVLSTEQEVLISLILAELQSINTAFDLPISILNTNIVDIENAVTGLSHLDNTPFVATEKGIVALGVRNDNQTSLVVNDLDYAPFATDEYGNVRVLPISYNIDNAPLIFANPEVAIVGGEVVDPSALPAYTVGDASLLHFDTEGRLLINTAAVSRTPALLRVTGTGVASITSGKRYVSFLNVGNTDATVLGTTLAAGEFVDYQAGGQNDILSALSYDALTSTLLIKTVV